MRNCLTVVLMLIVFGCSAAADDSAGSGGNTATGTGLNGGLGGGAGSGQFLPDGGTADAAPPAVAHLEGTVYAPEGTIPISGALVYATQQTPEPIPQKVFCDRCIKLEFDTPYTLSDVDGSFSLGIPSTGSWLLVVQKGAFRRVRSVEVATGKQAVDAAMSTLPGKSDPAAGDDIPRIAVAEGDFDAVENTLAKLGLGQVDAEGELLAGSESFDLITAPVFGWPPPPDERIELLTNYDKLSQYHIVMFPCAGEWPDGYLKLPEVSANLRKFVESGGRIYASDYSYDILRQSWPEPLSWKGDNGKLGSAETAVGLYDAPASVDDVDLKAWLAAQGIGAFTLEDNWTVVDAVHPYTAIDDQANPANFTPTVWVSGDVPDIGPRPATITYQQGCGRAMFSTYHTEGHAGVELMAQERALLYVLLEVAVCIGEIGPLR